jgi:uncharacterized protein (TIRG00374 family)
LSRLEQKVLLGILLGVMVYVVLALWADVEAVGRDILSFNWWWFAAALAMSFGNYLIRFVKWQYYLRLLNIQLPRAESFLVFFSSFLLTVTPGKVGEVVKSYLLKRTRGIAMSVTAPIVVAERLTDLLALMCLTLVGITTYAYGLKALAISAVMVGGLLFLISSRRAATWLIKLIGRAPIVGKLAPKLDIAYESMRIMVAPRPLVLTTLLSIAGWGLECVAFFWIIGGFDAGQPDLLAATFLYAFTTILGAISFLPGGLGVTEGSMSVGLVELGLLGTESLAVAATYLIRFATLWFSVILGLFAFIVYRQRYLDEG